MAWFIGEKPLIFQFPQFFLQLLPGIPVVSVIGLVSLRCSLRRQSYVRAFKWKKLSESAGKCSGRMFESFHTPVGFLQVISYDTAADGWMEVLNSNRGWFTKSSFLV
ncbi:MAG: hypothetical protein ACRDDF_11545, partial [Aeromonas sp.]